MKPRIGFLITHGTDTMAWGLAFISYALKNNPHAIAFVGSQRPMTKEFSSSDGYANIELAVNKLLGLKEPLIFLAFDDGKKVFINTVWKKDKWDTDAFTGKLWAEKRSNDFISFYRFKEKTEKLDKLYIIRTGGTIEATFNEERILDASRTMDVVFGFIYKEFKSKGWIDEIIDVHIFSKDSSDLTPEDWFKIANKISELSQDNGYKTSVDTKFESNIPIIFSSPLLKDEFYAKSVAGTKGLIFVGYGAGNVNIKSKGEYSPLDFFKSFVEKGSIIVLTSHSEEGIIDSVYENGAEVFKKGLAIPSLDFSIATAQVKLGFIIGHEKEILDFARDDTDVANKLKKILFLSGGKFASPSSKKWFEDLLGFSIPDEDLLLNREFPYALELAKRHIGKKRAKKFVHIRNLDKISNQSNFVAIVKLGDFIGENRMGVELDSSRGLETILEYAFEWDRGFTFRLWEQFDNLYPFYERLKRAHLIFWVGGNRLSTVTSTFDDSNSTDEAKDIANFYTKLFDLTLNERAADSNFPPSIYIGLPHQFLAKGLKEMLSRVLSHDVYWIPEEYKSEWIKIMDELRGKEPGGEIIENKKFNFSGFGKLTKYTPSKYIPGVFKKAHEDVSQSFSGAIEDIIPCESLDLAIIHDNEVNEEWILYLNWAFQTIRAFRKKYNLVYSNRLAPIPLGIEITSSLSFDHQCIKVASVAVYYESLTGKIYKDLSYQFHPELIYRHALYPPENLEDIKIDFRNDGIKILLWSILSVMEQVRR